MNNPWNLQLLTNWEDIASKSFTDKWLYIMEASPDAHVFFHPVLINLWLETYRPLRDIRPLFVHATCGEQQVIFPLVLWQRNWKNAFLRVVVPAGNSDFDYHDPIFLRPPTEEMIQSFYRALKHALDKNVSYDQILFDGIHQLYIPEFSKVIHQEECLSWLMDSANADEGLILPKKKKLAKEIVRRFQRLKEIGNVSFRQFEPPDLDIANDSLAKMLVEHIKRWPNAYKAKNFHFNLLNRGLRTGLVEFIEMSLDGLPIAWRICFNFKFRYSVYMPAINNNFAKYSPGHLSLSFALANAKENGGHIADHLRGAEDYKNSWGGDITLIYDVSVDSTSFKSKIKLHLFHNLQRLNNLRTIKINKTKTNK